MLLLSATLVLIEAHLPEAETAEAETGETARDLHAKLQLGDQLPPLKLPPLGWKQRAPMCPVSLIKQNKCRGAAFRIHFYPCLVPTCFSNAFKALWAAGDGWRQK